MFKDLTPIELHEYLEFNSPLILDVRELWEYEKCHLDNSLLMPMGSIISLIDTLDKDKETVVVCHHGIRSIQVARYFLSIGFTNIINLKGGLDAWARDIDPSMNTY